MNPLENSTTWKFYTSNPESWEAILDACRNAKTTIDLEIFIFTSDEIGRKFIEVCTKAVTRGVKVRFLWDAAGSFTFFKTSVIQDLRLKGVDLLFFKTLLPDFFSFHKYKSWYFRNHRRTIVIDGVIGFTGSTSIETRMQNWRDTMVKIEGPVVADMQMQFNRMWLRAQGRRVPTLPPPKSDYEFEYVTNNPTPKRRFLYARILEAIRTAEKSIYITVPYYVPNHKLARVIRLAAHRGVDIKIILPAASDFPTVDLGARTYFHQLLKAGIRIYLYEGKMIHTKSVIIDDNWSTIGTLNLDNISLLYNFEANLVSSNVRFAAELRQHFEEDLKNCTEITLEEWNRRFFVEKIATFFVHLIRIFL
jgi:cardiolipin synthase A/B